MMTKRLLAALLFTGSLSVQAGGAELDLGLCDKMQDLNGAAPIASQLPKKATPSSSRPANAAPRITGVKADEREVKIGAAGVPASPLPPR